MQCGGKEEGIDRMSAFTSSLPKEAADRSVGVWGSFVMEIAAFIPLSLPHCAMIHSAFCHIT